VKRRILILEKIGELFILTFLFLISCRHQAFEPEPELDTLTIFNINDSHAQIDNFARIKQIVSSAEAKGNVLVVSAGDNFSGNPVVDNYPAKGYPIIDLMNECGFDVSVLGNHEFDYGQEALRDRIMQSDFPWICANVDMGSTVIPQPDGYVTLRSGDRRITFIGFVETNGSPTMIIPSTHPGKLEGITFYNAFDIISIFSEIKSMENSDMVVALSHLGTYADYNIAHNYPFFDLVIGGHTHQLIDTVIGSTTVVQAGSYLHNLGKITVSFQNNIIQNIDFRLINLDDHPEENSYTRSMIDTYDDQPELYETIGYSDSYMSKDGTLGCFYTDALRIELGTDVSFQNTGGIRSDIDAGDITPYEIYSTDPFNNGAVTYTMTIGEIKNFLIGSASGFYYSGINIENDGSGGIIIRDLYGNILDDTSVVTVGINDYIPAVYPDLFPDNAVFASKTCAELIIDYLKSLSSHINYQDCYCFYRY
jgi:5'-nucleotidase/UDP-sugar diphosphatase